MAELKVFDGSTWSGVGTPTGAVVAYEVGTIEGQGNIMFDVPTGTPPSTFSQLSDLSTSITLPSICNVKLYLDFNFSSSATNSQGHGFQIRRGTTTIGTTVWTRGTSITGSGASVAEPGSQRYVLKWVLNDNNTPQGSYTYSLWYNTVGKSTPINFDHLQGSTLQIFGRSA